MSEAIKKVAKEIEAGIDSIDSSNKNYFHHVEHDICSLI